MKIFHIFTTKFQKFAFIAETVTQYALLWYNNG